MLYSEFIEGTGCKDNAHNYKVYKDLEVMYMNSDLCKADVYEYGKKLVDNSRSVEEIEFEKGIKEQIKALKAENEINKRQIEFYEFVEDKNMVDYYKKEIKHNKRKIAELNWVLQ